MNVAANPDVLTAPQTEDAQPPLAIYYLHPLLAGPLDNWGRHFDRCARMGFSDVLIAPPFQPGRAGNVFLTADHGQLNPLLGHADATSGLSRIVEAARRHGLGIMLDLVVDRVAEEAVLLHQHPDLARTASDSVPDPRVAPVGLGSVLLDHHSDLFVEFWAKLATAWLGTGVTGFRCDAPQTIPGTVWQAVIAAVRRTHPRSRFLAWTCGASSETMHDLAGRGFDFACSSSWAWDFRADWLNADTQRVAGVGRVLAMPEMPFGPRLARRGAGFDAGARRAAAFAAQFAPCWLMPMGFEFGLVRRMDAAADRPTDFPNDEPLEAIRFLADLNAKRVGVGSPAGRVVSSPQVDVAAILRGPVRSAAPGALMLVNARLDVPSLVAASEILPRVGGGWQFQDGSAEERLSDSIILAPGATRTLTVMPQPPILSARVPARATETAICAPRIAIEAIAPAVDGGRFPAKCIAGGLVRVTADILIDGHQKLAAVVTWRPADTVPWQEVQMMLIGNDRWAGEFPATRIGLYQFSVEAWVDLFASFVDELGKKHAAGMPLDNELREGREMVAAAAVRSGDGDLAALVAGLDAAEPEARVALFLRAETVRLMASVDARPHRIRHEPALPLDAERTAAGFSSWYELFPRSQSNDAHRHGTFADVIARLPAVREMGFDVLYMPPIHPIGLKNRKGRNNTLTPAPDDPGSPYAIGGAEGGHDAVHPELGTLADFRTLIEAARGLDMEVAIDFAIQCSPDHPWLREHPEWFEWRPDGTIRYAENPPKRYEDIVNVAFYAEGALPSLWLALRDVVLFWAGEGVRIFRVDNPHTKPLPFWEWMIADVRGRYPDAIFLAEAFTRPKVMYRLAKVGFSQSYTYFTWRDSAFEMAEYLTELTTTAPKDFFRPHFFVNTPDINPEFLQTTGRPGHLIRAALAATLSGLWGVYNGFEICEANPHGREEYLDSEKYQIRVWDWQRPGNIIAEIRALNAIRRDNPALHSHLGVTFLRCSNDRILCYAKATPAFDNVIVAAVSFDAANLQAGAMDIPPGVFGLTAGSELVAEDLLRPGTQAWRTGQQAVMLNPGDMPFALWRVRPAT